ncbi:MAG: hypothetical protein KH828_08580 [Clostridiales bacterium]|nr:hypothetical protein [Clostridiales bacterium]
MSFEILGVDLYHMLSWFIVYSFLGWVWESCYVSVKNRKWVNRGFVSGPFVTIYGVGAVAVYVILRPLEGRILGLYLAGVAVTTLLEYVTGVLMESIFHTNWWDYSDKKYNFQGKICLGSSIAWGFFTLILFYILQPAVSSAVDKVPEKTGVILIYLWLAYYVVDFSFSAAAAFDLRGKMQKLDGAWEEFQEYFQSTRLHEAAEELRERAELYRLEATSGKLGEYLEQRRAKFHEALERIEAADEEFREKREVFMEKYDEFMERCLTVKKSYRKISRRQMKAYPNLISKAERLRKQRLKKDKRHKK